MRDIVGYISAALTAVCVVGGIVWGLNSCAQQETNIREACIRAGGSVVVTRLSSHCIRGAPSPTIDGATDGRGKP